MFCCCCCFNSREAQTSSTCTVAAPAQWPVSSVKPTMDCNTTHFINSFIIYWRSERTLGSLVYYINFCWCWSRSDIFGFGVLRSKSQHLCEICMIFLCVHQISSVVSLSTNTYFMLLDSAECLMMDRWPLWALLRAMFNVYNDNSRICCRKRRSAL